MKRREKIPTLSNCEKVGHPEKINLKDKRKGKRAGGI